MWTRSQLAGSAVAAAYQPLPGLYFPNPAAPNGGASNDGRTRSGVPLHSELWITQALLLLNLCEESGEGGSDCPELAEEPIRFGALYSC
jgi:hypothetical protein